MAFIKNIFSGHINGPSVEDPDPSAEDIDHESLEDDGYRAGHLVGCYSACPPPNILPVCREAFGVVSKYYVRAFRCEGSIAQPWIDLDVDYVYLGGSFGWYIKTEFTNDITRELACGTRFLDLKI